MGSVMDQERPWERGERQEAKTMRKRIEDAYTRGGGNRSGLEPVMKQIINELERIEAAKTSRQLLIECLQDARNHLNGDDIDLNYIDEVLAKARGE